LVPLSLSSDTPDLKPAGDHDESPPLTPTGNAPSSESELDMSSPNASHDESQAKDPAGRESDKDLSHRPKRRRCHETYNFNMKCPTPGCNSLGKAAYNQSQLPESVTRVRYPNPLPESVVRLLTN